MYLVSTGSQDTYTWYVDTYVPGLHPRPPKKNRRPCTGSGSDTRTARQSLHSEVRLTTTASVTEGVAAVSWISIESLMIRRPFGGIDPNSIRETELHIECRRRREREACYYAASVAEIT